MIVNRASVITNPSMKHSHFKTWETDGVMKQWLFFYGLGRRGRKSYWKWTKDQRGCIVWTSNNEQRGRLDGSPDCMENSNLEKCFQSMNAPCQ